MFVGGLKKNLKFAFIKSFYFFLKHTSRLYIHSLHALTPFHFTVLSCRNANLDTLVLSWYINYFCLSLCVSLNFDDISWIIVNNKNDQKKLCAKANWIFLKSWQIQSFHFINWILFQIVIVNTNYKENLNLMTETYLAVDLSSRLVWQSHFIQHWPTCEQL